MLRRRRRRHLGSCRVSIENTVRRFQKVCGILLHATLDPGILLTRDHRVHLIREYVVNKGTTEQGRFVYKI